MGCHYLHFAASDNSLTFRASRLFQKVTVRSATQARKKVWSAIALLNDRLQIAVHRTATVGFRRLVNLMRRVIAVAYISDTGQVFPARDDDDGLSPDDQAAGNRKARMPAPMSDRKQSPFTLLHLAATFPTDGCLQTVNICGSCSAAPLDFRHEYASALSGSVGGNVSGLRAGEHGPASAASFVARRSKRSQQLPYPLRRRKGCE